ncbi:MAG: hypothetical protein JW846_10695 [Dehalococcoidia bacterium]|nr:hypothetical protein [Dehalococcoidia bacterium]
MDEYIRKIPEPIGFHLARLDKLMQEHFPGVVRSNSGTVDAEGWLDYAVPRGDGQNVSFAGARFRRDKSVAWTVLLSVKPDEDPQEWVHENVSKVARLPFAFGLPRPHRKDISDDEWQYVLELVSQAYAAAWKAAAD